MACAAAYAARCEADALLVLVADQPFVEACHLERLVGALRAAAGWDAVAPGAYVSRAGSRRGNPCLFTRACFEELQGLTGDEGARQILRARGAAGVVEVDMGDDPLFFADADTPEELARLEGLARQRAAAQTAAGVAGEVAPCR